MEQNTQKFGDILVIQEPVYDVTTSATRNRGCFCLTRCGGEYLFSFVPRENRIGTLPSPIAPTAERRTAASLMLSTAAIAQFAFTPEDDHVLITISAARADRAQLFKVLCDDYFQLFVLLQELVLLGIALPQHAEGASPALRFLGRPAWSRAAASERSDFSGLCAFGEYWSALLAHTERLIVAMDRSSCLPEYSAFPFGCSVCALLRNVNAQVEQSEAVEERTYARRELFDADGVLLDRSVLAEMYFSSADSELVLELVGFVFGVYPLDSTRAQREEIDRELDRRYQLLVEQERCISPKQLANNSNMARLFKVIDNDVNRTERNTNAFRNMEKPGPVLLTKLLRSFVLFSTNLGYLQGMNDLFVPIIKLYIPDWNEEGDPMNGDVKMSQEEIDKITPKIFWDFYYMLDNIDHIDFLSNVGNNCNEMAEYINSILERAVPTLHIWLRQKEENSLFWMFSSFVMLYKRNFADIWNVWLKIHCSPDPKNWLIYLSTAVIIYMFPYIPNDSENEETNIHDIYVKTLESFNLSQLDKIGKIAKWIYKNYPIDKNATTFDDSFQNKDFLFLK